MKKAINQFRMLMTNQFDFTGYFGAGIGSFFLFLRSLVWMNFVLLTFITIFVIVPQVSVLIFCPEGRAD